MLHCGEVAAPHLRTTVGGCVTCHIRWLVRSAVQRPPLYKLSCGTASTYFFFFVCLGYRDEVHQSDVRAIVAMGYCHCLDLVWSDM